MSANMEHDEPGLDESSPPRTPIRPAMETWSAEPFSGSPSTTFAFATPSGATAIGPPPTAHHNPQPGQKGEASPGIGATSSSITTDDFIALYDRCLISTDLLLVSFIPDDIRYTDFCDTMDRIQRHLKVRHINNYYQDPTFASKFSTSGPGSWADDGFSYPEEHHSSFLLRLGGNLPFSHVGHPNEATRPTAFSLQCSPVQENKPNRWLVIQPVPPDFTELYLRPPMAVWRGIGLDASLGSAVAGLQLVSMYVDSVVNAWRAEDATCEWSTFSFLSVHKVDIKPPPKRSAPEPRRHDRGGGRNSRYTSRHSGSRRTTSPPPLQDAGGPTQAQYGELFVITVCTAPIGRISRCFDSLIPPSAAYGLPLYPIRLCGWWVELARSVDTLRTNDKKIAPNPELLSPCPTLRVKGLKAGATLGKIVAALGTETQDVSGICAGYIHRGPGGDSCTLLTNGARLLCTKALRPLASSHTLLDEPDMDDFRKLRERYAIFRRSVGLSTDLLTTTATPPSNPPSSATALIVRPNRPTPPPTFSELVRALPREMGDQIRMHVADAIQQEVARINCETLARVTVLEQGLRHQEETQQHQAQELAQLDTRQAQQGNALMDLEAGHETMRDDLREAQAALANTTAQVGTHHTNFLELRDFLERQDARMDTKFSRIESTMQTLFKRRGTDFDEDGPSPPASPGQGTGRHE